MSPFPAPKKALAEYPTYAELKAVLGGMLEVYGLEVHHLIDQHLIKRLNKNNGDAIHTMPAFVLDARQHREPGVRWTQHLKEVEEKFMNELVSEGLDFNGTQLRRLLRRQYKGESNEPIHHALDLWLTSQGI